MPKLGITGLKWLKTLHLLCAGCWLGGALSLTVLNLHAESALNGSILYGINSAASAIDLWVVIVGGANGCLVTGLAYGLFTTWGFFRQGWLVAKWGILVFAMLFGTFFLGNWEGFMLETSYNLGLASFFEPRFTAVKRLHLLGGLCQLFLLALAVGLSVFRPKFGRKAEKF